MYQAIAFLMLCLELGFQCALKFKKADFSTEVWTDSDLQFPESPMIIILFILKVFFFLTFLLIVSLEF